LGVRPPAEHWALEKLGDRLEKNLSHLNRHRVQQK
jgi:hypothetical protein